MDSQALILLVEDNRNDVLLMERGLRNAGILNPCHVCSTGEDAIAYLQNALNHPGHTDYTLPALILLDLNLPGRDGFEVLRWIRSNSELDKVRVIVTTVSSDMRNVNRAYQLGANSFLTKPVEFELSRSLLSTIDDPLNPSGGTASLHPTPPPRMAPTTPAQTETAGPGSVLGDPGSAAPAD